ncbi:hypothetical protein LR48_Vigan05g111500 [Vigna angularis]|uniref:Uncharacterized protein n=1 Tax=Phaseolus angularis TaxID=3914 RepID=A0A0L9ULF0_PHAAN|nr:hypothetical protein LR48_Vigan05g111500 [Vigna angularis]
MNERSQTHTDALHSNPYRQRSLFHYSDEPQDQTQNYTTALLSRTFSLEVLCRASAGMLNGRGLTVVPREKVQREMKRECSEADTCISLTLSTTGSDSAPRSTVGVQSPISSPSAPIQVDDHRQRNIPKQHTTQTMQGPTRPDQNDYRAMAGYALVVASTALQSHCQWVPPYHPHEAESCWTNVIKSYTIRPNAKPSNTSTKFNTWTNAQRLEPKNTTQGRTLNIAFRTVRGPISVLAVATQSVTATVKSRRQSVPYLYSLQIPLIPVYVRFIHVPLPPEALPGAAPCLCPLHHATCTGVTPRTLISARIDLRMEYVSPEGLRLDGRKPMELHVRQSASVSGGRAPLSSMCALRCRARRLPRGLHRFKSGKKGMKMGFLGSLWKSGAILQIARSSNLESQIGRSSKWLDQLVVGQNSMSVQFCVNESSFVCSDILDVRPNCIQGIRNFRRSSLN